MLKGLKAFIQGFCQDLQVFTGFGVFQDTGVSCLSVPKINTL